MDSTASKPDLVGFVGLGNIGLPMTMNLLSRGYRVIGHDLRPCAAMEVAGGVFATELGPLAEAPVLVFSLPSTEALTATVDALLPLLRPGQVVIDLGSNPIDHKRAQAQRLAERGVTMLDCEVSGLPLQVTNRTAVIFKAGDEAAIRAVEPIFDALAERHFYLGDFGSATKMKLIANAMVCVNNLMAAEALHLGQQAGLDPSLMVQVLGPSAAGSVTFLNKAPLMLSRAFENGRGPFRHMFGYLARATELSIQAKVATPLLDATRRVYEKAKAQGRHDQDIAAIIEVVEQMDAART